MKRLLLFTLFTLTAFCASAQQYLLSGHITGPNNEPISFSSVYIRNSTYGTTANEEGRYQFRLSPGTYRVVYRYVGYREKVVDVTINNSQQLDVKLDAETFTRADTTDSKYDYRTDRGTAIMREVIANRQKHMEEFKSYSCQVYIKGVQKLLKAPKSLMGAAVIQQLDLDSAGRGILYQSESVSEFNLRQPNQFKEITIASKVAGRNPAFSYNKASDLQLNIYENVFTIEGLTSHGFVSPVASNAFKYYRYRLAGTTVSNGRTINKIQLIPRGKYSPVFKGNIYIIDGEWRVYSVDLMLTNKADNINLIDTLTISQQYIPVRDSVWLPGAIQYNFEGTVFGFKFGGYYVGIYNNYKIDQEFPDGYFNGEVLKVDTAATSKPNSYWSDIRPVPLTGQELRDYRKKDSLFVLTHSDPYLDSLQRNNNHFNPLDYSIFGYEAKKRSTRETYYVNPFIKTLFYNTVEGWGLNLQVKYTKKFEDFSQYSITPVLHYGFSSKMFSPNISAEYLRNPIKKERFFTSLGADVLDLNNVGTRSFYFNTLSSLLYENNYVKYYRSRFGEFGYEREVKNGVLFTGSLGYSSRKQLYNTSYNHIFDAKDRQYTSNNPLAPAGTPPEDQSFLFPEHQALTLKASLAFTFSQRYLTRPDGRVYEPSAYPKVTLNYRKGIKGIFGADADYDFGSVDVTQEHLSIGLLGYSSFKVTAGSFFTKKALYFMDYNHFLGNQGTTFDPTYIGSFHFLPFYQFSSNSSFIEAHYQHNFAGYLFNRVPLLRKLKLEEVAGVNYLSERNNPNYTEFYVGIQRLFFRVDYGVSYADNKKYIQGIRIFYGIR
jgi:hypothetical protein